MAVSNGRKFFITLSTASHTVASFSPKRYFLAPRSLESSSTFESESDFGQNKFFWTEKEKILLHSNFDGQLNKAAQMSYAKHHIVSKCINFVLIVHRCPFNFVLVVSQ